MLHLDSQATLRALDDNPRLGARARQLIGSVAPVHVLAATVFELTIKAMRLLSTGRVLLGLGRDFIVDASV